MSAEENLPPKAFDFSSLPAPVMQAIYYEITGKTEAIIKGYREARKISVAEIEQISIKLHQICEQFKVVGEGCVYTVRHTNSMTQKFSSLEKFKQYDESLPYVIDSIIIEYSVLIESSATKKHHQYKVDIVIESLEADKNDEAPDVVLAFLDYDSIKVKIDYVDYVIARTFIAAVDEWVQGLERLPTNGFVQWARNQIYPKSQLEPILL